MSKITILCALFLFQIYSLTAAAKTSLVTYSGTYETVETNTNGVKIYAGSTNSPGTASCGTTASSDCDSCANDTQAIAVAAAVDKVCSRYDIKSTRQITFVIKVTDNTALGTGTAYAKILNASTNATGEALLISPPTYTANSELSITTTWGELCNMALTGGSANCTDSFSQSFYIGFNTDNGRTLTESAVVQISFRRVDSSKLQAFNCASTGTEYYQGVCYFELYPGDEKAILSAHFYSGNANLAVPYLSGSNVADTVDRSGMKYKKIKLMYQTSANNVIGSTMTWLQNHSTTQEIEYSVDTNKSPPELTMSDKRIRGLQNGTTYQFISANIDQAGIVSLYSDSADTCITGSTANLFDTNPSIRTQCVTPQKVYGLLEGQNCFIATAAYGSGMAKEVDTFRAFRNQFLLKSQWGRNFVETYYRYSPAFAAVIQQSEILRFISRLFLWPFLLFAHLSLKFGLPIGLLISWIIIFSVAGLVALAAFIIRRNGIKNISHANSQGRGQN